MYQQLLQQEQQNARTLEDIAQKEQKAAHIIQTALHGHQMAMQQLQQVTNICRQLEQSAQTFTMTAFNQQQLHQPQNHFSTQNHFQ
ncbi:hypothetical protein [Paenibacillus sp. NEAU-GSW1]|uniref:hypothetical protein n=1 Tax=Paenibacillus sp. NEAU-GSW1 TaxID=2682486 RepID=UPI003463F752